MFNVSDYSKALVENEDGIWSSDSIEELSYPEDGNDLYNDIEDLSYWFKHRKDVVSCCVKKYGTSGAFFDIGGGNGLICRSLQDHGQLAVLLEPGPGGVENAKKRGVRHIIFSSLQNARFETGSLPNIGLFDVLEHIEDEYGFIEYLSKVIQPGGTLFLTVPAFKFLWSVEDELAGHFRRYTIQKLTTRFRKFDFEPIYSSYLFSFLPLPIYLMRVLPSKLGLIKGNTMDNRVKSDHEAGNVVVKYLMNRIIDWELEKVRKGEKIGFGSSCFVVLRKQII